MALEEVGGTIVDTRKYMYKVTRDFTTIFTNIFLSVTGVLTVGEEVCE